MVAPMTSSLATLSLSAGSPGDVTYLAVPVRISSQLMQPQSPFLLPLPEDSIDEIPPVPASDAVTQTTASLDSLVVVNQPSCDKQTLVNQVSSSTSIEVQVVTTNDLVADDDSSSTSSSQPQVEPSQDVLDVRSHRIDDHPEPNVCVCSSWSHLLKNPIKNLMNSDPCHLLVRVTAP